ncbi:hypothetical protein SCE1572_25545 [Sorangium cellulosum So0157-2]|uniref:GHMP kinase N-terminal domain-containing protein n=1 Tax=Sorangium cellulosum So0157-2 TaxID=1254432 RepID=S4XZ05_SORCE|nr:hypothetical protein SCE1572_25545 [Sorangium cellulosum So0157-2]
MIVRAPGKLVLSGAYAVLEGAPALVAAVDRYVVADPARQADLVTEEVQAAIDAGALDRAAWFDASALRSAAPDPTAGAPAGAGAPPREASRKLGLGSSAAILVATLAARAAAAAPTSAAETFPIDAAASTVGFVGSKVRRRPAGRCPRGTPARSSSPRSPRTGGRRAGAAASTSRRASTAASSAAGSTRTARSP